MSKMFTDVHAEAQRGDAGAGCKGISERAKHKHEWEDEVNRDTTVLELILDKKLKKNEAEAGLSSASRAPLFRKHVARCSTESLQSQTLFNRRAFPDYLLSQFTHRTLSIPSSVTFIG